jgi:subtilase family serine protease
MKRQLTTWTSAWLLLGLVLTATAGAAQPRVSVGEASRLTEGTTITGTVASARRMRVTIGMESRDPLGLKAYSEAVATPGDPQYGHFLTVRQFARRFGATGGALTHVRRAMRADGLRVVKTFADRLSIIASGTAATVERAFAVHLAQVRTAEDRRTVINTTAPTVPTGLGRDVEAVLGLGGLAEPSPGALAGRRAPHGASAVGADVRAHVATGGPQPCSAASAAAAPLGPSQSSVSSFGYTANIMAAAYGAPSLYARGDFGQGQTIAVYEQQSLNPSDVAAYQACYRTHAAVRIHNVDTPDPVDYGIGGDGEAALDVEAIIGIAPRASIIVYTASQTDADGNGELLSAIVSQDAAKIVSTSYDTCEAQVGRTTARFEAKLFEEMAVQGQSVFADSGDQGSEACSPPNGTDTGLAVADPASQPSVTAVGGTSLYSGSATEATRWNGSGAPTEGIWNSGSFRQGGETIGQATTGGLSSLWAMPSYQSSAAASLGVVGKYTATGSCGAPACREVPDVSADGDQSTGAPIYSDMGASGAGGSSWHVEAGTSLAAPLWAAFAALTNAQASCRGLSIGDIDPALYSLASSSYAAYFRDVDAPSAFTGDTSNDPAGTRPGVYPVGPGYDLATGLGAPLMGGLAPALCALRVRAEPGAGFGRVSLTGITTRRARLRFTAAEPHGRRLRSVTVHLTRASGLSLGELRRRVSVTTDSGTGHRAVTFELREHSGSVTIHFREAQTKVLVDFGAGAIRVSAKLARDARDGARVTVGLSVTDTRRHTSQTTVQVG